MLCDCFVNVLCELCVYDVTYAVGMTRIGGPSQD